MTDLAVLITALTVLVSVVLPLILQFWVVKWSLDSDECGRRHAIRLLRELHDGRQRTVDWVRLMTSNAADRVVRSALPDEQDGHVPPTPDAGPS